jgi:pimeloyl-ACP methyl ester carboxylesterase
VNHDTVDPEFRWLERGDGEPVLLLHGLMGRMDHWDTVLDLLADTCRPLALSLPIFDPRRSDTSIEGLAAFTRRFLDALDLPHAVVGGNSLGGHVALALALEHPDRVSGLILTGSSGLFERSFTRGVPHRPSPDYVRRMMEDVFHDPALVTSAWVTSVCQTLNQPATARRLLRFARAARRHNLEERLHAIRVPTLAVWGADDRITPPAVAARFHALIAHSDLALLPRCGHAPMLEQPAPWSRAVRAWLEATRARRAWCAAAVGTWS